jgi:hypothetical protein
VDFVSPISYVSGRKGQTMGIPLGIALEVYYNPYDLFVIIDRLEASPISKYFFRIERKGRDDEDPMSIASPSVAATVEEVARTLRNTLGEIQENVEEALTKTVVPTTVKLTVMENPVDPDQVLNAEVINWIVEEVMAHRHAQTWEMHTES